MKLQQLRYYEAAGRLRSITRAAEEMHVSQPSVSMAIQELEREFGLVLIQRKYQGFALTAEGEMLLEHAKELLHHADNVSEQMSILGRRRRPVRLGVPPMIGALVLPELHRSIERICPDLLLVTEELGAKMLVQELKNGTLDLAFISYCDALLPELEHIDFSPMEIVWCARTDHPLNGKGWLTPQELENEPLVLFQSSFQLNEMVLTWFSDAGIEPFVRHSTGQLSTVESMIRAGVATGFLLRPTAVTGEVGLFRPLSPSLQMKVSLVWKRRNQPFRDMERLIRLSRDLPI